MKYNSNIVSNKNKIKPYWNQPKMLTQNSPIKRAANQIKDEEQAVKSLAKELHQEKLAGIIFFCSSNYDLKKIQKAVNSHFNVPVIGCTTAGEIGLKYQKNGMVGLSFCSDVFSFQSDLFEYDKLDYQYASERIDKLKQGLKFNLDLDKEKMFGLLLNDGLAMQEENAAAYIHKALSGVSLIGGTAGDDFKFESAPVFINGQFCNNVAAFALIESKLPFNIYKIQHVEPSDIDMVITRADPSIRRVYEINGLPAGQELARIIGVSREQLIEELYSTNPIILQIGSEWYVRSIQQVYEDDSISFACAIDEGLVLNIGKVDNLVCALKDSIKVIKNDFKGIQCTIGCECVHRQIEIESRGNTHDVEKLLAEINFMGFHTYGEQFNSIHMNQTLTCVVIGER